jgi:hypothetical protein
MKPFSANTCSAASRRSERVRVLSDDQDVNRALGELVDAVLPRK